MMKNRVLRYISASLISLLFSLASYANIIIAIDAGHGGRDPGAIGKASGLKEKEVTLAVAKELKALLDKDPHFKAVLTRDGDYSIALPNRTEIARKHKANYLISIHADSSPVSENLKGASVWVLSNRRANDELGKWLEDHEKQSELLGGAGSVLADTNERYVNQTVLDLQFSHSQRTGYELGRYILAKLGQTTKLAKKSPQHASLSVLRSPDIPSILVEVGFLSNASEEQKLATVAYRKQVARAIYNGLVSYRQKNPQYTPPKTATQQTKKAVEQAGNTKAPSSKAQSSSKSPSTETSKTTAKKNEKQTTPKATSTTAYHTVQANETLYSIARAHKTTPEKLSQLNNIKNNHIIVGQRLKVR